MTYYLRCTLCRARPRAGRNRTYRTGAYSMQAIAEHFGVSRMTVSRPVKHRERTRGSSDGRCEF